MQNYDWKVGGEVKVGGEILEKYQRRHKFPIGKILEIDDLVKIVIEKLGIGNTD